MLKYRKGLYRELTDVYDLNDTKNPYKLKFCYYGNQYIVEKSYDIPFIKFSNKENMRLAYKLINKFFKNKYLPNKRYLNKQYKI